MTMSCLPNDPDELDALYAEATRMDRVIETLFPRSPRAGARPTRTPSLPSAGAGNADIRHFFERDVNATGV